MHTREDDDLGLGARGGLRELQRVPHEVGNVLDVALLVVVREHDGLALAFEGVDRLEKVEVRGHRRAGAEQGQGLTHGILL